MGNNGALTAITALPLVYANCYMWFTANQIAAGVAAGWYFTQMSSATAGTVFNNTYTSGKPTIPASPTAFVTTGPGAFTGDTAEEFGPTIAVPANSMGPNGALRITTYWAATNNANTKTTRVRFSGNAGTQYLSSTSIVSQALGADQRNITNRGVANSQVGNYNVILGGAGSFGVNGGAALFTTSAVDTTGATSVVISLQKGVATDDLLLEGYVIEVLYGA